MRLKPRAMRIVDKYSDQLSYMASPMFTVKHL